MKGVTQPISILLITIISIAMVMAVYMFFLGFTESKTKETFIILDAYQNLVIVSNIGLQPIDSFTTILDANEVPNTIEKGTIEAGNAGIVKLETDITKGMHTVLLISGSRSQRWTWFFGKDFTITTTTT